ncbi:MAG: EamA family transporter [Candidatus Berkiella sp.]
MIAFSGWVFHQKKLWQSLLGALVGFIGVWFVLTEGKGFKGYHWDYSLGYLYALLSCLLWSSYVIMTRKYANLTSEMMGMYLGVGGAFALIYHLLFEPYIAPTPVEWCFLLIKGCLTLSVSYFCWDFAIKRGHFALLNVLSYFNPLLTLSLLSALGFAVPLPALWLGAILVTSASVICSGALTKKTSSKN